MKSTVKYHFKLVRDLIPEILNQKGIKTTTKLLDDENYRSALLEKLQEEVFEFQTAQSKNEIAEELADILEVIYAFAAEEQISKYDLEVLRKKKSKERGAFTKKIFLEKTVEGSEKAFNPSPIDPKISNCLFCKIQHEITKKRNIQLFKHCYAILDDFPVSQGHTLIIPYEHTDNWFTASSVVKHDIISALDIIKKQLNDQYQPEGYNVGMNCGAAPGQSINHLHVHLIPRYQGDHPKPKGGVRGVIPEKQNY